VIRPSGSLSIEIIYRQGGTGAHESFYVDVAWPRSLLGSVLGPSLDLSLIETDSFHNLAT
jgi:hypothetical protein